MKKDHLEITRTPLSKEPKTCPEAPTHKQNCWEVRVCGREPGGTKAHLLCECPAAVLPISRDGYYNNGSKLGRRCWRAAGTLCNDVVQGIYAQKIESCRQCRFYLQVRDEEGEDFIE